MSRLILVVGLFLFVLMCGCTKNDPLVTEEDKRLSHMTARQGWMSEAELLSVRRVRNIAKRDKGISDDDLEKMLSFVSNDATDKSDLRNSNVFQSLSGVTQWTEPQKDKMIEKSKDRLVILDASKKFGFEGPSILWALSSTQRREAQALVVKYTRSVDQDMARVAKIIATKYGYKVG